MLKHFLRRPLDDTLAGLELIVTAGRPLPTALATLTAMVVTWFVYVPIHEMLHVAGCALTGGTVTRLELAPHYFGTLLARVFPFVVSGSDYAGQLTGFDTKGNDLTYLATDFGPYLLTVLFGVTLLRMCGRKRRPLLFAAGIVVGLAPFYSVSGDYYEMGSIITTRLVTWISGGGDIVSFVSLRSDDVILLVGRLITSPGELGLEGAGPVAMGALLLIVSLIVGILLAFVTYALGGVVAERVWVAHSRVAG